MNDSTATRDHEHDSVAHTVFAGLVPNRQHAETAPRRPHNPTVPILLVGTLAVTMNLTAQPEGAAAKPAAKTRHQTGTITAARAVAAATAAALPAPATYRVVAGDTISHIASRYGLSTSAVLVLNGLRPSSLIFPGQVIRLAAAGALATASAQSSTGGHTYTIVRGDTISAIAKRFGVATTSVLAANGLGGSSIIYPGQKITIPGASTPVLDAVTVSTVTPTANTQSSYVIKAGDTISTIARRFGVSVSNLLSANGLSTSSIIYAGATLVIPGTVTTTSTAGALTLLQDDQAASATTIIAVGRRLGVPDYGIVIALSAAMQESKLRNLDHGHLDSVGLFQQRPSSGWGTVSQLTTPSYAARLFFGGPSNPNRGVTRGLLDISGWQSLTVTQAAQKVQVSAYPNAYAKWESSARLWLSELG